MAIRLSALAGGGEFIPTTILTPQSIAPGVTGTILTVTPPAGKRAALLLLHAGNGTGAESSIRVSLGGEELYSGSLAQTANVNPTFKVGIAAGNLTGTNAFLGVVDKIVCPQPDQTITVEKMSGATTLSTQYTIAYGD
jgi:hypothetical protein